MTFSRQWLAGFFDGEGCINITVAGKHRRCILRLYLVNTDYNLLAAIKQEYGGQLVRREHPRKPTWKPYCALTWTNSQASLLLNQIGEFIILKRMQLDLAREFLALRESPERYDLSSQMGIPVASRTFVRQIRPQMLEQEASLKARMHRLNAKGKAA